MENLGNESFGPDLLRRLTVMGDEALGVCVVSGDMSTSGALRASALETSLSVWRRLVVGEMSLSVWDESGVVRLVVERGVLLG